MVPTVVALSPNANIMWPHTIVPALVTTVPAGEHWLACAVGASHDAAAVAPERAPSVAARAARPARRVRRPGGSGDDRGRPRCGVAPILGMSAVLLPFTADGAVDWPGFESLVARTVAAGLVPAVNMDTGYVQLLDADTAARPADSPRRDAALRGFVAGAFVADDPGARVRHRRLPRRDGRDQHVGGHARDLPVARAQRARPTMNGSRAHEALGRRFDRFIGFELGPMFVPYGRIYSLAAYEGLLGVPSCIGAKHSSLSREAEWDRLEVRDRVRPDFHVFTGNDLAIDMVCYGSDYLLGLSAFAPEAFAERDRRWEHGERSFHELNDLLQYLGRVRVSGHRSPRTDTTRRCSCSFAVASGRTRHRLAHPDGPTATARSSPTSRSAWSRCCDRRRDRPGEAPAHDRRAPRRGSRRSASPTSSASTTRWIRRDRSPRPSRSSTARPARTPWAIGSRCCPWKGGTPSADGRPSDLVRRRWRRFGESGAKLVWGGEAVAVRHDGRANPRQLVLDRTTVDDLAALRADLVGAHVAAIGSDDGLVVGLQLTHSGRWSRPTGASQPLIAYHHPVLDRRVAAEATVVLIGRRPRRARRTPTSSAAVLAADAGFDFVDVKHCHGYLLHELLGAIDRPGAFGGSFEHRTAFLRRVVDGIRARVPHLAVGVRLSGVRLRALRGRRGWCRRAGARRSRGRSLRVRW